MITLEWVTDNLLYGLDKDIITSRLVMPKRTRITLFKMLNTQILKVFGLTFITHTVLRTPKLSDLSNTEMKMPKE